ncbi:putative Der1-like family [Planoprotostelium fungivorum]|uniref:Derlin n=1 Tax=Planoprotostelium fungivorum TaxID=1890364 RepID=A0A2P6NNL3_9EUKA|nr:putative Der1-like family [Planoprotostelium fungivorum]
MSDQIKAWWSTLPICTKYIFACTFGCTLASAFGLASPLYLVLIPERIFYNYEIYRIVTCFFLYFLGFPFLMDMVFLINYGVQLEQNNFSNTADYVYFLLTGSLVLLLGGLVLDINLLGPGLIRMIIYVWARKNPDIPMTFMFGLRFQSFWLPWVMMAFNMLMGGSPYSDLLGIVVGHLYYFLTVIYPNTSGKRLLQTPEVFYTWFPQGYRPPIAGRAAQQAQAAPGGRVWGPGQALGGR